MGAILGSVWACEIPFLCVYVCVCVCVQECGCEFKVTVGYEVGNPRKAFTPGVAGSSLFCFRFIEKAFKPASRLKEINRRCFQGRRILNEERMLISRVLSAPITTGCRGYFYYYVCKS